MADPAVAIARVMGLDAEELDVVLRASELHDIGKIAIPDAILEKRGPLDPDEPAFMRRHPAIGDRILSAAPALRPVARVVRASHAQWDGTGYPDGLSGERVPLGARVIAVCDAFSAMTSQRPWRPAMSEAAAVARLRREAGVQFDPAVVGAFETALSSGPTRSTDRAEAR